MGDAMKSAQGGGEAKAQPSGPDGGNPATAGAKKNDDVINPSSPGETGTSDAATKAE